MIKIKEEEYKSLTVQMLRCFISFCENNDLIDTTKNIGKTFTTKKQIYHLDHILVNKKIKYENPTKHNFKYKKIYISDHFPVSVDIKKISN